MSKLAGLNCLVTGGAGSLGLATIQNLIHKGAKVILCDLPTTNGEHLAKAINKERCIFVPTDVTSESDVKAAIDMARSKFGGLDVLVNCAGISSTILLFNDNKKLAIRQEIINKIMAVNCVGTFNAIRLACEAFALNECDSNGQRGISDIVRLPLIKCLKFFPGLKYLISTRY